MKFYCGKTKEEKYRAYREECLAERARLCEWHNVFLWWPRRMEDGLCHWLERVERKYDWWMNDSTLREKLGEDFDEWVFDARSIHWRIKKEG